MQQTSQSIKPTPPWRRPGADDAGIPSPGLGGPSTVAATGPGLGGPSTVAGPGLPSPGQEGPTGGSAGLAGPSGRFKPAPHQLGPPPVPPPGKNKIGAFSNMDRPPAIPTDPLVPNPRPIIV